MKKRLMSSLLILAMCIALLAGCGSGAISPTEDGSATPDVPPAADDGTTESAPPEEDAPPAQEADGEIVLPLTTGDESFSFWVGANPNAIPYWGDDGMASCYAYQELMERTGVTMDFITISNEAATERFNVTLAGEDYPDVFLSFTNFYTRGYDMAISDDIVINLADYLETEVPNYWSHVETDPGLKKWITTDAGNIGGFYALTSGDAYSNQGPVIRQDLLDAVNMSAPVTLDDYYNVMSAIKAETGTEGALIVGPGKWFCSAYDVYGNFLTNPETKLPFYQVDGEVKFGFVESAFKDYMTTMAKWYEEGLIYSDYMSVLPFEQQDLFASGKVSVWFTESSRLESIEAATGYNVIPLADAVMNVGDTLHTGELKSDYGADNMAITTQCENLDLLFKFFNYTYSEEGSFLLSYGVEGKTFEYDEAGTPQLTDLVMNNPDGLDSHTALEVFISGNSTFFVLDNNRTSNAYSERLIEAADTMVANIDSAYTIPSAAISFTPEENEIYNGNMSDMLTYMDEMLNKFLVGAEPMENWDAFVQRLNEMGIQECIDIYQAAYDRYLGR